MHKVIKEIADERQRQIEREGWDAAHDDEHADGSLAAAAACYALPEKQLEMTRRYAEEDRDMALRGESPLWKTIRRCFIVRAAALLVAEIERIDRAQARRA